ncbi:MAG: hypothetical protein LBP67_06285 [Bacteroidales bacterium]|jgi:alanyl-tRNA synthetase|nr:hypothetical protein [Bacteroidales bacterium]
MNNIVSEHNKQEYPPMHTAEHILNQTMVRMFGCERSRNAHIERKKSKCDYNLESVPSDEQIKLIEKKVNEIISQNLIVIVKYVSFDEAKDIVDLTKLPENITDKVRIVMIGDYDICACVGAHVNNTSEIGIFMITSHDFENNRWRVRFRLIEG